MSEKRNNLYFCIAALMLAGCAGWLYAKNPRLIKNPLPIRKPLIDMDRTSVQPFEVVKTDRLSPEIVENLGTQEYINWVLVPEKTADARPIILSVTYYTGVQDQIPHVPEECFTQGGMTQESDRSLILPMPRLGEDVPIRRFTFNSPRRVGVRQVIYYTICVNGFFCSERNTARLKMADPRDSHLYYSKVEVAFDGSAGTDLAELDHRAAEVVDRTLSELRKSHWPPKGSERGGSLPAIDAAKRS